MDRFILVMFGTAGVFVLYIFLAIFPTYLYAEAECLRKGYPRAHVSIGLERYCMTIDGAVVVKVVKQ